MGGFKITKYIEFNKTAECLKPIIELIKPGRMFVKDNLDEVMEGVREGMPSIFEKQGGEDGR